MIVGRNIRAIRKQRGLTLEELSQLCGVHQDDLGGYERGKMTPRPETVKKIAQALDVPIVAISQGLGWSAPAPAEQWELGENSMLHDGILAALKESSGEALWDEDDILALMESVKASIPALVDHMKDVRPESVIHSELLKELDIVPEDSEEALIRQCELTDGQWEQLQDLLPPEKAGRGRAFKSNRLMLNGILFWMKSGVAWKNLPACYGRYKCVSDRLRLWRSTGVWEQVLDKMVELGVIDKDGAANTADPDSGL